MFRSLTSQRAIRRSPSKRPPRSWLARVYEAAEWWAVTVWLRPSCSSTDLDNAGPRINRVAQLRLAKRLVWTWARVGNTTDDGQVKSPACKRNASFTLGMAPAESSSRPGRSFCKVPDAGRQGSPGTAGSSAVSPTSSPRGLSVEHHITATIAYTPLTPPLSVRLKRSMVQGPRPMFHDFMAELVLCPSSRAFPLQPSVCGSANKEPATLILHIHSVANRTWETRLTAILMGRGASSRHRARRLDHLGLNESV